MRRIVYSSERKVPGCTNEPLKDGRVAKGLGVNADKPELVLFSRRYNIKVFNLSKLDRKEIKLSEEAKYLGVVLNRNLNWKSNVEARRKKHSI